MLSRFRDSLIYPEYILNYRKDSIFRVILILLIYASIMSLATIVDVVSFDGLSIVTKEEISESLVEENIPCEIIDTQVLCDEPTEQLILNYYDLIDFYVADNVSDIAFGDATLNIVFSGDKMYLGSLFTPVSIDISELPSEFHNLSFRELETNPEAFITQFTNAIDTYMINTKAFWGATVIITFIFFNFLLALFVSLLTGFFIRNRYKMIPFGETFRFGAYISGSTFIMLGLMSMLGYSFIYIVIIILLNSRQMRRLVFSIDNVLKNNLPKKE